MTDGEKQMMLLEERYAELRVRVRDAYVDYMYVNAGNRSEKYVTELKEYLESLKAEIDELEEKLGDDVVKLYGNDDKWWVS